MENDILSVSYAREFFLPEEFEDAPAAAAAAGRDECTNVSSMYAERRIRSGDVVATELDDPSCEAGRSENPNCALCEVDVEVVGNRNGKRKRGKRASRTVMGVVALRDIPAGEFITVAPSDEDE
jgi:hypothetical protein